MVIEKQKINSLFLQKKISLEAPVKSKIEQWGTKFATMNSIFETEINRNSKNFHMFTKSIGHYGVKLKVKKMVRLCTQMKRGMNCLILEPIKVNKVNNHRSADKLIDAYSRAGWMIPKFSELTESSEEL